MVRFVLLLAVALLGSASAAFAQKKVALVIGNGKYQLERAYPELKNPSNDVAQLASMLKAKGFTVIGGGALTNLSKSAFENAIEQFGNAIQNADVALLFYGGHGMQISGDNYLVPTDAPEPTGTNLNLRFINATRITEQFSNSNNRLNIMLLDACRNNPLARKRAILVEGLAAMQAPAGTVIGFSTQPGKLADDGEGDTSPYVGAVLRAIQKPGLDLFGVFNEVGISVMEATNNEQQPWISASPVKGRFFFTAPSVAVANANPVSNNPAIQARPVHIPQVSQTTIPNGASVGFVQQAYRELSAGHYAEARRTLDRAIQLDRTSATAFSYRGFASFAEGNELLKKALDDRRDMQSRIHAAEAARELYKQAFPDLDEAIQLDPNLANARRHRGNTILAVHKTLRFLKKPVNNILDNAILDLDAATKIDSSSKLNWNALGDAYRVKGLQKKAIESYDRAILIDRSYASPYSGRCTAHLLIGNSQQAQKDAQLAAERSDEFRSKACLRETALSLR